MRKRIILVAIFLLSMGVSAGSASVKEDVKKGNLVYNNAQYDEALKIYEDALVKDPDSQIVNFNIGDALYKKGSYENAISSFNKAIASGDPGIISGADYNIGNAQYKLGLSAESADIDKSKECYETALKYYKRSIDLDPDDKEAKFNYEFVDGKLKELKAKKPEKEQKKSRHRLGCHLLPCHNKHGAPLHTDPFHVRIIPYPSSPARTHLREY